jgi:tetratricopeptide (TPR) repeat protein
VTAAAAIHSDLLLPLRALVNVQRGALSYYRELRRIADPYISVGAWCALLDAKLLPKAHWEELLGFCRYGAVRTRAFRFFQDIVELRESELVAAIDVPAADFDKAAMLAELRHDARQLAELHGLRYLATGDLAELRAAMDSANAASGWRDAAIWAVRAVAVAPLNPATIQMLFNVLDTASRPELLEEAGNIFVSRNMYLQIAQIFLASAAMARGEHARCLKFLQRFEDDAVAGNAALTPYLGAIRNMRATALEATGDYRKAFEIYQTLNNAERSSAIDPQSYYAGVRFGARLDIPALPPDPRPPVVQMLGFPRAGTTLLETVIGAHPLVEAFEEIPSLSAATAYLQQVAETGDNVGTSAETFSEARARYYAQLLARRRKNEAKVLLDKMPLRSAEAALCGRLFPEWRYIFSIRHPYDVVLSCFKQRFVPNAAMENFRSIDAAVRLYDFTMTEWFGVRKLDDPDVHYIRYEDLVTDFRRVVGETLNFLGLSWDDGVLDFARHADSRPPRTPSYRLLRKGLTPQPRTQWKNYRFAFSAEARASLDKWSAFFGYPTD